MMKKHCGLFLFMSVFCCFFLSVSVFADDVISPKPFLTMNPAGLESVPASQGGGILLAMNTSETSGDDLDAELMDEYDDDASQQDSVADPLYYFNYAMYGINDFLYTVAVDPLTQTYKAITPTIFRQGVSNFFHNLMFPVRCVNNLLQGKWSNAGEEVEVFLINTTIGVAGFYQAAQNHFDLITSDEDLGQTFGTWSIGEGFYLFLPIIGPTTLRDAVGIGGDSFLNPVNYVDPWELSTGLKVFDGVNDLSFHLGEYEELKEAAVDPYAAIKNAYIQNRNKKIRE